jgi:hypothetical protein
MFSVSTVGLSVSVFVCTEIFFGFNILLSLAAYTKHKDQELRRTLLVYGAYFVMYGTFLVLLLVLSHGSWDANDTLTMKLMSVFVGGTFGYALWHKLSLIDPLIKGLYSLGFKTIPQLLMAWKILILGGAGVSFAMLLIVHLLTLIRLGQIFAHTKKLGYWDRNMKGLALAELGNEVSWTLVTLAWLMG